MGEKVNCDLGLSLSFNSTQNTTTTSPTNNNNNLAIQSQVVQQASASASVAPFGLSLFRSPLLNFMQQQSSVSAAATATAFHSLADRNVEPSPLFRGIDMNQPIPVEEEVNISSSPNTSTVSSLSGKRSRERDENDVDRAASSSLEVDDDGGGDAEARKKLRLSKEQGIVLEEAFKEHNTLTPKQKMALAKRLNLRPRQVEVWFQNRRARTKLKQTEVDCEYLRRCCENLTDENRRLQKEVTELRTLKLSPQFYMNMNPPTTLTMCPQCERVSSSSAPATSAIAPTSAGGFTRQGPNSQRPKPMTPWASIFASQSADAHRPQP